MENLPQEVIQSRIYEIRNLKVMLDSDLAKLYEVETKRINEAVKNNPDKFPEDFYFELTFEESEILRSKFSTFKDSLNNRKYNAKVFTEQGVYMLATVLKSKVATEVTINIMRTFTKLREFALTYKDIIIELKNLKDDIKLTQNQTNENSQHIKTAFEILSQILQDSKSTEDKIMGFRVGKSDK
jgi:flagellar capping protein FliD